MSVPRLETERLLLRALTWEDAQPLRAILGDAEVMYAWGHAFTDEDIHAWLEECFERYGREGFAYLAAVEKETGALAGVIGPLVERIEGEEHIGVGYILAKAAWGKGFAAEGARACMEYAFTALHAPRVVAVIRPENVASRRVARSLGMCEAGSFVKHYRGVDMPHLIYARDNDSGKI